ncbi:DDE-domain-containing protein, partial [Leucogyrophana mollusca]
RRTIRQKVFAIAGRSPSRNWLYRFLGRHPEIKLGRPSGLDPKRGQYFNRTAVKNHFDLLREVMEEHNIPWENVYNMDEKGCQHGGGRGQSRLKHLISRQKRSHYKFRSDNLELVTVIECVCADGTNLQPGFVFSGKQFSPEWFQVHPDICVSTSPNGWTDDFLGAEWFKQSFVPQATARNTSGQPILLIFDGHGSHMVDEIREAAIQNNIHLFCLPAHTTHKLQPLDVGVFGPLQHAWRTRCDTVVNETGEEIPRENFVKEYM